MPLRDRREKLCEHFFEKNIDDEKLKDLLPNQFYLDLYNLRPIYRYHNYVCRTERFKNSLLTILNNNTYIRKFFNCKYFYICNNYVVLILCITPVLHKCNTGVI